MKSSHIFFLKRYSRLIRMVIVAFIVVFYLFSINSFLIYSTYNDFGKFYASIRLFLKGKSIYTPIPLEDIPTMSDAVRALSSRDTLHPNLNPPFQTLLFLPFGFLKPYISFITFSITSILFGFAAVIIIHNATRSEMDEWFDELALLILLLLYFPTWATLLLGQVSLYLLLLLTFAWVLSRSGKDELAGIVLGLALSIKIFIGIFLIFFLIRRRWRLLSWCLGTFLACNLVSILVFGSDSYAQYLNLLQGVYWYSTNWNASFLGFFMRIFGGSESTPLINMPQLANFLAYFFSSIALVVLAWLSWPREGEPVFYYDLIFSLSLVIMLLVSPLGWMYYFPLLVIPFVVLLRISKVYSSSILFFLALAWTMTTIPRRLIPAAQVGIIDAFLWSGFYFYGLLVFAVLLIISARFIKSKALN